MMFKPGQQFGFFLLCILALGILLIKSGVHEEQIKHQQRIVLAQEYAVSTLDPAIASDTGSIRVIANVFEGLVRLSPVSGYIEPCLAESWEVSGDGLTYTFHLRQGVSFHDGKKLNGADVATGIEKQLSAESAETTYTDFVYAPLAKLEVVDAYTIAFHLKHPYAPFLNNLAMPMAAPITSETALSGTGPYMYDSHVDGGVLLKANPHYWDSAPAVKEVLIISIPQEEQRVEKLLQGQIDIALDLSFAQTAQLRLNGYPVLRTTGWDIGYLGFYTDQPPFQSIDLRRLVASVLDCRNLLENLWSQETLPALSLLPPNILGGGADIVSIAYAPEFSRQQLASAGYPDGLSFSLITYADKRPYSPGGGKELAQAIAEELSLHNINVTVQAYPWPEYKEALKRREGDAFLYGWSSDNMDPDNFFSPLLTENQIANGLNITRYHNALLEALLAQALETLEPTAREDIYRQAQEIIANEVPLLVLNHSLHYAASAPKVQGFILSLGDWPVLGKVSINQ